MNTFYNWMLISSLLYFLNCKNRERKTEQTVLFSLFIAQFNQILNNNKSNEAQKYTIINRKPGQNIPNLTNNKISEEHIYKYNTSRTSKRKKL